MIEITGQHWNRTGPTTGTLRNEVYFWLERLVKPMGLGGEAVKRGRADLASIRWKDDGTVEVQVYLVNADGKLYVDESSGRKSPAREWRPCPIDPPAGLTSWAKSQAERSPGG